MKNENLGAMILVAGGAALVAYRIGFRAPDTGRLVLTWKKNPDGTCTFTYDDGSQETGVCTDPPA